MYAVIKAGAKQCRVTEGDVLRVERIPRAKTGDEIELGEVVAVFDGTDVELDASRLAKAKVIAEVIGETKGPKVTTVKYRRRKDSRQKIGHRQIYTEVKIKSISCASLEKAQKPAKKADAKGGKDAPAEGGKNVAAEGGKHAAAGAGKDAAAGGGKDAAAGGDAKAKKGSSGGGKESSS